MLLKKESLIKELTYRVSWNTLVTHELSSMNLNDRAVSAEDMYMEIGSVILGCNLENTNKHSANFPVIDLCDKFARIAAQVTVDEERSKIDKTLKSFLEKKMDDEFTDLYFFIVGRKPEYKKPFEAGVKLKFDPSKHIIDNSTLYSIAKSADLGLLEALIQVVRKHIEFPQDEGRASACDRTPFAWFTMLWTSIRSVLTVVTSSVIPDFYGEKEFKPEIATTISADFLNDLRMSSGYLIEHLPAPTVIKIRSFLIECKNTLEAIERFSIASVPGEMRNLEAWATADSLRAGLTKTVADLDATFQVDARKLHKAKTI